ncbi:ATP-binding protein [Colwellia psychrerythraea]|uniref:ATP-binding protein n=1 Tax=Colwellia psychrerythraea TaxID=28229 RepID=UPI00068A1C65|nr:ATP-binding protein [Colwellia psychrerythraea]
MSSVSFGQSFLELKSQLQSTKNDIDKLSLLQKTESQVAHFNYTEQSKYWFLLGTHYEKQRQLNDAVTAFTKGINLHNSHNLSPSSLLVNLHIERSRAAGSVDYYNTTACEDREKALLFAREISQPSLIAKSIAYYAKCLQSEEHGISNSLKLFDEAFTIAKTQKLEPLIKQIIYNQAASLSFRALIYDKAYEYNELAHRAFTATNDTNSVYVSIINAIHYSSALVDIELAKQHLAELKVFAKKHPKFKGAMLKFYYLSAKIAQLEEDWPLSISFLETGLTEITNSQNISYIQATYELLSISYFRVGNIEKSYQTLLIVEQLYPNKKPIKQEILLIKGMMTNKPDEIAISAFKLIDKEKQSKNRFVRQSNIQASKIFDDNLKQLDNIILEQKLTVVLVSTFLIIVILIVFSYLQIQRKKLALKEKHFMDKLLTQKNKVLADVSHELSTPLTVLKLQVESLKDNLEEDVQASYDALDNKVSDIENLIADIHQLAQSDVGALQLNIESFDLNRTLGLWENELSNFVNKNKLTFEINRDLPNGLLVSFDRDRVKQVFINLLTNSIKYTDKPGKVKLSASAKGNTLYLSIEDSAPGILDKDLAAIFERLYRVESSRSRDTGGSGLGLAICKSLIEAHSGEVYAEHSKLGGLKIVIQLPI